MALRTLGGDDKMVSAIESVDTLADGAGLINLHVATIGGNSVAVGYKIRMEGLVALYNAGGLSNDAKVELVLGSTVALISENPISIANATRKHFQLSLVATVTKAGEHGDIMLTCEFFDALTWKYTQLIGGQDIKFSDVIPVYLRVHSLSSPDVRARADAICTEIVG